MQQNDPRPPCGRNDIPLLCLLDGEPISHFRLREFENPEGLAMVHADTLVSLEKTRRDLCAMHRTDVWIIITNAVRTQADLERLAARLGWTDQGGAVARDSRHLARYGGIAVDLIAVTAATRARVPQKTLGSVCRRHFDFVKDDYRDGHVHADNRFRATPTQGGRGAAASNSADPWVRSVRSV